ncbi:MAG: diaminopimelate decarboxylase [Myxococcota bacterium]
MSNSERFQTIRTEIAGVSIHELAAEFGTPTFVYDAARIHAQIDKLQAFDVIRYAQKASSNLAILDLCRERGVLVDAVSEFEIRRALAAGYPVAARDGGPPPIVYTADIFDRDVLDLVVARAVHVNCGSPQMIDQLGARSPGVGITLRINPGFGHGHSQKTNTGGESSKHGIWYEDIPDCVERAARHGIRIVGLHMHIGSGTDFEHLSQVCHAMESAAKQAGDHLESISAGGGLPTRYREDDPSIDVDAYFRLWDKTRTRIGQRLSRPIGLEIEPGRYISAESGYLISEIRAIKQMGKNLFYLVDAGFNNLARPILYGAYHPISIVPADPADTTERDEVDAVVAGPLCESGDIFTQEDGGYVATRKLPRANVGEHLVIECAGAYAFVMGSNYNSKPLAAEVLIRDGEAELIRERQSFEDLIRGERIL